MPGCTHHPGRTSRHSDIVARKWQRLKTELPGKVREFDYDEHEGTGWLAIHDPDGRINGTPIIAVRREGDVAYLTTAGKKRRTLDRLANHAISAMRGVTAAAQLAGPGN